MIRMRTAEGVLAIIKEQDPNTKVTLHYLRSLIKTYKVPVTPVGRKRLVNADVIIDYISAGGPDESFPLREYGQIRPVPERGYPR